MEDMYLLDADPFDSTKLALRKAYMTGVVATCDYLCTNDGLDSATPQALSKDVGVVCREFGFAHIRTSRDGSGG